MPGRLMLPATVKTTGGSKRERFTKCGGSRPYRHRDSLAKMDTRSQVPSLFSNYSSSRRDCSAKIHRSKSLDLSIKSLASLTLDLIEFWKQFPIKTHEIATLRELTKCQLLKIERKFSHRKSCEDSDFVLSEGSGSETLNQETNEPTMEKLEDSQDGFENGKNDIGEGINDSDKTWNPWSGSTIDYCTRDGVYEPELNYNYLLITEGNGFQSAQKTFDSFLAESDGFLGYTGNSGVSRDNVVLKKPLYQR